MGKKVLILAGDAVEALEIFILIIVVLRQAMMSQLRHHQLRNYKLYYTIL